MVLIKQRTVPTDAPIGYPRTEADERADEKCHSL